jgi:hypothetical protein
MVFGEFVERCADSQVWVPVPELPSALECARPAVVGDELRKRRVGL